MLLSRHFCVLSILFTLCLTGCAASNISHDYSLTPTGKGIVVFSFSTGIDIDNPYLKFRNTSTSEGWEVIRNTFKEPLDWETPPGRLVVIELDPGSYEFYTWIILYPSFGVTEAKPNTEFSIPFRIEPGKATYIGNLDLKLDDNSRSYDFDTSDQSARDLELFHRRYRNIKPIDVIKTITKLQL